MNYRNVFTPFILFMLLSACANNIAGAGNVVLERDSVNNTVAYLKGEQLLPSAAGQTTEQQSLAFLLAHRKDFLLQNPGKEFSVASSKKDELGYTHVKLAQEYEGIPVWKGQINMHFNPKGALYLVQGQYFPTPSGIEPDAGMSEKQLLDKLDLNIEPGSRVLRKIIYFKDRIQPRLAYEISSADKQKVSMDTLLVDAITGEILNRLPSLHTTTSP